MEHPTAKTEPVMLPTEDKRTVVKSVRVTPVVRQHDWLCEAELEFERGEWTILLCDVYALNQWQDQEVSTRVKLPDAFPRMLPDELAAFLNRVPPGEPVRGGYRAIRPEEVACLLTEARRLLGEA